MSFSSYTNDFDSLVKKYSSIENQYDTLVSGWSKNAYTINPIKYKQASVTQKMIENYMKKRSQTSEFIQPDGNRTMLDRIGDAFSIGVYPIAGALEAYWKQNNAVTTAKLDTPWEAFKKGIRASNPFGEGYVEGEKDYISLLNTIGSPDDAFGKFMTGAAGFLLDVVFDPTNLIGVGEIGALVKGTGMAAHAISHADEIAKISAKYGEDVSKGMTTEIARKIIIQDAQEGGRVLGDLDKVEEGAEKLSKWYNDAVGLKDYGDQGVSLSLGNMLGGQKLFGKMAEGKIVLTKSATIAKLSEKTIAPTYGRIRNAIQGTELMRKFSKNALFYDMAKKDPGEFYNFFRMLEDTRGLNISKMEKDAIIKDFAEKNLKSLSPADHKKLIELMEDPSQWKYVTEKFKFIDTKVGAEEYARLEQVRLEQRAKVRSMLSEQNKLKRELKAADKGITEGEDALKNLRDRHMKQIEQLDLDAITDINTLEDVIKVLHNQHEVVTKEIDDIKAANAAKQADAVEIAEQQADDVAAMAEEVQRKIDAINEKVDGFKAEARQYVEKYALLKDKESPEAFALKMKIEEYQNSIAYYKNQFEQDKYHEFVERWGEISKGYNILREIRIDEQLVKETPTAAPQVKRNTGKIINDQIKEARQKIQDAFDNLYTKVDEAGAATTENAGKIKKALDKIEDAKLAKQFTKETTFDELDKIIDGLKTITKSQKKSLKGLVAKMRGLEMVKGNSEVKTQLLEEIGEFLNGDKHLISPLTTPDNVAAIMTRMQMGKRPEEILEFITNNQAYFSGRATEVYQFIAMVLGYGKDKAQKSWYEYYQKQLDSVIKIIMDNKTLEFADKRELELALRANRETIESIQDMDVENLTNIVKRSGLQDHQVNTIAGLIQKNLLRNQWLAEFNAIPDHLWQEEAGKLMSRIYDDYVISKQLATPAEDLERIRRKIYKDMIRDDVSMEKGVTGVYNPAVKAKKNEEIDLIEKRYSASNIKKYIEEEVKKLYELGAKFNSEQEALGNVPYTPAELRAFRYGRLKTDPTKYVRRTPISLKNDEAALRQKLSVKIQREKKRALEEVRKKYHQDLIPYDESIIIRYDERDRKVVKDTIMMRFNKANRKHAVGDVTDKYANRVTEMVGNIIMSKKLNEGRLSFDEMSPDVQNMFIYKAMQIVYAKQSTEAGIRDLVERVMREQERRNSLSKVDKHLQSVQKGTEFLSVDGKRHIVHELELKDNGMTAYKTICNGIEAKVDVTDIDFIIKNHDLEEIEEIVQKSPVTSAKNRALEELEIQIKKATDDIEIANKNYADDMEALKRLETEKTDLLKQADEIRKNPGETRQAKLDKLERKLKGLDAQINVNKERLAKVAPRTEYFKKVAQAEYVQHRTEFLSAIKTHQIAYNNIKTALNTEFTDFRPAWEEYNKTKKILENKEAFDTFMRMKMGSDTVDKIITKEKFDLIDVVLKDDVKTEPYIRAIANRLRADFNDIAREEIKIGKLLPEQLEHMMLKYLPHILTPAGEKMFASGKIEKTIQGMGDAMGFGRVWNPFGKNRSVKMILKDGEWTREFSVIDENLHFLDYLKGNNAFSENICDIYLARMSKHTEMMYDNELMERMLKDFGYEMDGTIRPGYKAVINCGKLKDDVRDMTRTSVRFMIEDFIEDHFQNGLVKNPYFDPNSKPFKAPGGKEIKTLEHFEEAPVMVILKRLAEDEYLKLDKTMFDSREEYEAAYDKIFSQLMRKEVKRFYREELYPDAYQAAVNIAKNKADDVVKRAVKREIKSYENYNDKYEEIYNREYNKILNKELTGQIKIASMDMHNKRMEDVMRWSGTTRSLGDLITPMVEMEPHNYHQLMNYHDELYDSYKVRNITRYQKIMKSWNFRKLEGERIDLEKHMKRINDMNKYEFKEYVESLVKNEYKQYSTSEIDRFKGLLKHMDDAEAFHARKPEVRNVHETIVNKLNQTRKIQIAKDQNELLHMYDKFTHWIKLMQTTVLPGWHISNKKSNIFNNWLAIGADSYNLKYQRAAFMAMKNAGEWDEEFEILNKNGVKVGTKTWKEIYNKAMEYGVISEGFVAKDLGTEKTSAGLLSRLNVSGTLDPTDTKNFFAFKMGASAGNVVENTDRLIHFMSMVRRGGTWAEAAESVDKFLFDYSDLTAFEMNVMKRIFPFYTWMRKNTALQLEQLFEQPKKYQMITKVQYGIENFNPDEDRMDDRYVNEFALDWIQTPFRIKNAQGKEERILYNTKLPYMDLSRFDPFSWGDTAKSLFSQTNALIKGPVELANNYNFFFENKIMEEKIPDVTTKKGLDRAMPYIKNSLDVANYAFSQLTPYTIAKNLGEKSGVDWMLQLGNTLTGEKILSYDYETYKYLKVQQLKYGSEGPLLVESFKRHFPGIVEDFNSFSAAVSSEGRKQFFRDSKNWLAKKIVNGAPLNAEQYVGALRPISQAKYNKLSEEEKLKYMPPNVAQSVALNREAVRLAEEAKQGKLNDIQTNWGLLGTGVAKLAWSFFEATDLNNSKEQYQYGEVTRVLDGDTFEVNLGNGDFKEVRLLLVDTPESVKRGVITQPGAKAASDYTKHALFGKDVKIIFDTEYSEDKYGRMLAYVEYDDGEDLAENLIQEGLAKTQYIIQPPYDRLSLYKKEQTETHEQRKGIWNIPGYIVDDDKTPFRQQYDEAVVRRLNKLMR